MYRQATKEGSVTKMNLSAIVFVASASALLAQESTKPAAAKPSIQVQAEVVSVDTQARTMVVKSKGASLEQATLSVDTKASAALSGLHKGDEVTLTCRPTTEASGASDRQDAGASIAKACGMVTGIAQSSTH
jgi:hypothetical protein